MNRPLGGGERQWWLQSQRAACNVVLVTCIDAPVDRERFARAMSWLQRRYPLLAASLELRDGEPYLATGHAPPIPVTWKERSGPHDWRAFATEEVTRGFTAE